MNCTPIVRQRNSNDWGAFMSRHTFEDKLKAIDLYLNKRNSYRETAKLMSATKSDIIKWVALSNDKISAFTQRKQYYSKYVP